MLLVLDILSVPSPRSMGEIVPGFRPEKPTFSKLFLETSAPRPPHTMKTAVPPSFFPYVADF